MTALTAALSRDFLEDPHAFALTRLLTSTAPELVLLGRAEGVCALHLVAYQVCGAGQGRGVW